VVSRLKEELEAITNQTRQKESGCEVQKQQVHDGRGKRKRIGLALCN
jgi:hypothetical protein